MRPGENIEKIVKKYDIKINPEKDQQIFDELKKVHKNSRQSKQGFSGVDLWRIIMKSKITGFSTAAVILLCVFGILVFLGNGNTLYAQIIKAIESADTIYVINEVLNNGEWEKNTEIWYDRTQGVLETTWKNNEKKSIHLDNGEYAWKYNTEDNYATRTESMDPMGMAKNVLNVDSFKEQANRVPVKDKVVDGIHYTAYILSRDENTWQLICWLDKNSRVLGWEQMRLSDSGQWKKYGIGKVMYNIEIDPELFKPDFGEFVSIVDLGSWDSSIDDEYDRKVVISGTVTGGTNPMVGLFPKGPGKGEYNFDEEDSGDGDVIIDELNNGTEPCIPIVLGTVNGGNYTLTLPQETTGARFDLIAWNDTNADSRFQLDVESGYLARKEFRKKFEHDEGTFVVREIKCVHVNPDPEYWISYTQYAPGDRGLNIDHIKGSGYRGVKITKERRSGYNFTID